MAVFPLDGELYHLLPGDQLEVDTSSQLSSVRIHIEQVIVVLRQKYTILEGKILINMSLLLLMVKV